MKVPMTPRSYAALRDELHKLKGSRPELAHAIEVARELGDISENADYDAAKEKSGMVEAKIRDIEAKLAHAQIINPAQINNPQKVMFGVSVKIVNMNTDEEKVFMLVGADESNVQKGLVSFESPIGKSLIGKAVGDIVTIQLPGGKTEYEITDLFVDYKDESEA
jgi:transcription elongation factor GreA